MSVTAWYQNHDFESTDAGAVTFEQALSVVQAFDWDGQYQQFCRKLDAKADTCPPGVGFDDADNLIHICRDTDDEYLVNLTLARPGKLFGIFSKSPLSKSFHVDSLREAEGLLEFFFKSDFDRLRSDRRLIP